MTFTELFSLIDAFIPKAIQGIDTVWAFADWKESESILARPLYKGISKNGQLAYLKDTYKGKNENGGRACKMVTPASYKNNPYPTCIPWGTMRQPATHWVPESPRTTMWKA